MSVTIDGNLDLGVAVSVQYQPNANAQQVNEFFGVNGRQTLFGGTRGSVLMISGLLVAPDIPTLNAVEANLLAYAGPLTHTVVDNRGRFFLNMIFEGSYQPDPIGPRPLADGGFGIAYKLEMVGLT